MKLTVAKSNMQTESKGIRIVHRYNKNGQHPASHYSMEQCYAADGSKSQPNANTHWSPITNFDTAAEAVEYAQKNPAAVALGRLGGKAGSGAAKARTSEQARAAVAARWAKTKFVVLSQNTRGERLYASGRKNHQLQWNLHPEAARLHPLRPVTTDQVVEVASLKDLAARYPAGSVPTA